MKNHNRYEKSKNIAKLLLLLLVFIGCNKETIFVTDTDAISSHDPLQEVLSLSQQREREAFDFLNKYLIDQQVAYAPNNDPNSAQAYQAPSKKYGSRDVDTTYYFKTKEGKGLLKMLVFKESGYILISDIDSVPNPPVLFYDKGKFDEKKPNPVLVQYIAEFLSVATPSFDEYKELVAAPKPGQVGDDYMRDKGLSGGGSRYTYSHTEEVVTQKVGTLLNTSWSQRGPFDDLTPNSYPAGCVAIAIGQIVNYHKKAKKTYNWSLLSKTVGYSTAADYEKAKLSRDIGSAVNMKYAQSGSSASNTDAASYLRKSGYKNVALHKGFSWNTFKASLDRVNNGRRMVVYLSGYANKAVVKKDGCLDWLWPFWWCHYTAYSDGHAWIGDGYKIIRRRDVYKKGGSSEYRNTRYIKYIHMNWGWGGYSNGWTTYTYWKGGSWNFQHKKQFITYRVN